MKEETFSALTIIDEMIGHQARGGPGGEVVISFRSKKLPTCLDRYGGFLGLEKTTKGWKLTGGPSCYDALYLTRSVLECLYDALPEFNKFSIKDQLGLYLTTRTWDSRMFVKYAKYMTVWPMARYLHNALPAKPLDFTGSPLVFKGHVKRFLKNRLIAFNDKNTRLWLGYLQGVKRGAAVVSENFIHDTMLGHRKALSTAPSTSIDVINSYDRYVERSLDGFWPSWRSLKLHEASTSASYESKRSTGGARQTIIDTFAGDQLNPENFLGMVEDRPGHVVEMRGYYTPSLCDIVHRDDFIRYNLEVSEIPSEIPALENLIPEQVSKRLTDDQVMVSAVCEPLKVRLISKGNSMNYYIAKDFQKKMWKYLQIFPQFQLTGRPMDKSDLYGLLLREDKLNLGFDKWVSGDYSAATDGIDYRLTEKIFKKFLVRADFPPEIEKDLWKVIGLQEIHYPKAMNKNGELDPIRQLNGQLMGSPLSFPILCLINLCAYWKALEFYIRKHSGNSYRTIAMKDLPVLINGDDILFRANDEFYAIWKSMIAEVGFSLSIGKNYIHKSILTINSKMYRYIQESRVRTRYLDIEGYLEPFQERYLHRDFKYLGFLNCGLLTGQSKITGREVHRLAPIWSLYNKTIPDSVDPLRTHKRFLHYHKTAIESFTGSTGNRIGGNFNIFLPPNRGGLGFEISIPRDQIKVTSFQRKFASYLEHVIKSRVDNGVQEVENIGLVRKSPSRSATIPKHHNPHMSLYPCIGPLESTIVSIDPKEVSFPRLSRKQDPERPEYFVRLPTKLLKEFRDQSSIDRMSDREIFSWPWRLVEDFYPNRYEIAASSRILF